jgi:hypothetical protein
VTENRLYTKVCKTFIHRFDSDPRLQPKSPQNQSVASVNSYHFAAVQGSRNAFQMAKAWRSASESLAQSLARSLARPIPPGDIAQ